MKKAAVFFLIFIFTSVSLFADKIILIDNSVIDGKVVSQTTDQYGIKVPDKMYYINKSDVLKIVKEPEVKKKEGEINWMLVGTAAGGAALFVLMFMLARAGNNY